MESIVDEKRERLRDACEVPGDHAHRAELAERARGGEHHAVGDAPTDRRQCDAPECLPRRCAERARRLLLHKQEIDRLHGQTQIKGHTLVALRMYWKDARVKIEIGVGKGKEAADKREDLKEKASKRETDREVARFNKRHA